MKCKVCGATMNHFLTTTSGECLYVCHRLIHGMSRTVANGRTVGFAQFISAPCGNIQDSRSNIVPDGTWVQYKTNGQTRAEKISRRG